MLSDPEGDAAAWERTADRLIALFEGAGDDLGAALAWRQKSAALWLVWRLEESGAAAERASEHARAAGNRLVENEMRGHRLATLGLGRGARSAVRQAAIAMLEEARASGDRRLEMAALRGLAMNTAYGGDFPEARSLIAESRAILVELGLMLDYWAGVQNTARIEILAGDLDEGARLLREGCEHLIELGETAFLSTTAAVLAHVEFQRGNALEAHRWIEVADRAASPDDRSSQIGIDLVRGLLLLADGDPGGEQHLRSAMRQADETDGLIWRSEIRLDIARALPADRREDIVALARDALALAEEKEVPIHVEGARAILAQHDADVGP
jgi:hypothetical protein